MSARRERVPAWAGTRSPLAGDLGDAPGVRPELPSDPPLCRIEIPGGVIAYTDEGSGPCLVAVHGLPGSHRDYRWLASALAGRVRLVRIDQPGFAASRVPAPPTEWSALADLVLDGLARVIDGPFAVMGHSFGAPLATWIAARGGARVNGLVWLAPVSLRPHRLLRRAPPLRLLAPVVRTPVVGELVLRAYRRAMISAGFPRSITLPEVRRCIDLIARFDFAEHAAALALVRAPCFGAWTEDDPFVEPEVIRDGLAQARPGPRIGFADGGHNLQKTHAVELADALAAWLAELPAGRP